MASKVDALQKQWMGEIKKQVEDWTERNPESYDDDKGERKSRKVAPPRGYVEKVVNAVVMENELAAAFVEDALASIKEPAKK